MRVEAQAARDPGARDTGVRDLLRPTTGRPLVLVVRDLHRHDWMGTIVRDALTARPDAVVVEPGVPVAVLGAVHVATCGASRACAAAAAAVLAGR